MHQFRAFEFEFAPIKFIFVKIQLYFGYFYLYKFGGKNSDWHVKYEQVLAKKELSQILYQLSCLSCIYIGSHIQANVDIVDKYVTATCLCVYK